MKDHVTISILAYAQVEPREHARIWRIVAGIFIVAHPLFFYVGACLTWALRWVELGHPPRPMIDDPKNLGAWIVGTVSLVSLVLWPLIAFLAIVLLLVVIHRPRSIARLAFLSGCAYVLAIVLIQLDPGSIICWILD